MDEGRDSQDAGKLLFLPYSSKWRPSKCAKHLGGGGGGGGRWPLLKHNGRFFFSQLYHMLTSYKLQNQASLAS